MEAAAPGRLNLSRSFCVRAKCEPYGSAVRGNMLSAIHRADTHLESKMGDAVCVLPVHGRRVSRTGGAERSWVR